MGECKTIWTVNLSEKKQQIDADILQYFEEGILQTVTSSSNEIGVI